MSWRLATQPAFCQRSRSQRAVRYVRPIRRASWSTVIAYCSPIRSRSRASRSDIRTLPKSRRCRLPAPSPTTRLAALVLLVMSLPRSLISLFVNCFPVDDLHVSPLPLVHGNRPAARFVTTRTHRRCGRVVTNETPQATRGQRDENRGG